MTEDEINKVLIKSFKDALKEAPSRQMNFWLGYKACLEFNRLFKEELERQIIELK